MAKLTEQDRRKIIELIKQGIKTKYIAEQFNVTTVLVRQLRDSYLKDGETAFIIKKIGRKNEQDLTSEQRRIKELERKVKLLEEELELQKKFQAYLDEVRMKNGK